MNGVNLREQNLSLKCCQSLEQKLCFFPKRYCESLLVKGLQSYSLSNFEDDKIVRDSNPSCMHVVRRGPGNRIFSNLQLRQLVALQPFNLQKLTIPLQKDLDLFVNILSAQETSSILKIVFALSNLPPFQKYFFNRDCIFFATAVRGKMANVQLRIWAYA